MFLYHWRTDKVIWLAYQQVHGHKHESGGQFLYHELLLQEIAVQIKDFIYLCNIDSGVAVTPEVFGEELPDSSPGTVTLSVLPSYGGDEGNFDFYEYAARSVLWT